MAENNCALEILRRELVFYRSRKDESESNINDIIEAISILENHNRKDDNNE